MKKRLIAVIITAVMCLAVLSGCSLMKSFEHDLQVVLMFDGEYYGSCTVNIFNNGVVEKPDAPKGYKFKGWTPQSEWSEDEVDGLEIVTAESGGGLIRYNDVKDYVKEGTECVTLYGVVAPIPQHDIKIAWYGKEGTSGLNQDCMDVFKDNLYGYLSGKGLTPADMDIVIENYGTGDVATTCAKVMDDGDVDIMLGWSTNITTTGGMQDYVIENVGKIKIGSKDRYAARLSDTELCNDVFIWIQNEYGPAPVVKYTVTFNSNGGSEVSAKQVESGKTVSKPANPTKEGANFDGWYTDDGTFENAYDFSTPVTGDLDLYAKWTEGEPENRYSLVIGWWNYSTSGLDETTVNKVVNEIKKYLVDVKSYKGEEIDITVQSYTAEKIAGVAEAVNADDNVDIMFGLKAYTGINVAKQIDNVKMGTVPDRRILLLSRSTSQIAQDVYEWFETDESARNLFAAPAEGV